MISEALDFILALVVAHPWLPFALSVALVAWRKIPRRTRRRARRWAWRRTKQASRWAWRRAVRAEKRADPRPAQRPENWTWPVEPGGPTVLYRYYDADWRLLYVGITGAHRGGQRNLEHVEKPWYRLHEHYRISDPYPTRADAKYAEAIAIRDEKPIYNIVRPDPERIGRPT